jgi:hypothetical protein
LGRQRRLVTAVVQAERHNHGVKLGKLDNARNAWPQVDALLLAFPQGAIVEARVEALKFKVGAFPKHVTSFFPRYKLTTSSYSAELHRGTINERPLALEKLPAMSNRKSNSCTLGKQAHPALTETEFQNLPPSVQ